MIPFEFEYHRPDTFSEAVELYKRLERDGKEPLYYGGGTEIISMGRTKSIYTKAVIDIKGIPECNILEVRGDNLIIGAAVTLTQILESSLFPLLSKAGGRVADHTIRDKITIGGNICGRLIYREAVLPLLLAESIAVIAGANGERRVPFTKAFQENLRLEKGELLLQVMTDVLYTQLPHLGVKKTKIDKIDYPLISLAAMKKEDKIRLAITGLCAFPFRSFALEEAINEKEAPIEIRIEHALVNLPAPIMNDIHGSAAYRDFVFRDLLRDTLEWFEELA